MSVCLHKFFCLMYIDTGMTKIPSFQFYTGISLSSNADMNNAGWLYQFLAHVQKVESCDLFLISGHLAAGLSRKWIP